MTSKLSNFIKLLYPGALIGLFGFAVLFLVTFVLSNGFPLDGFLPLFILVPGFPFTLFVLIVLNLLVNWKKKNKVGAISANSILSAIIIYLLVFGLMLTFPSYFLLDW